MKRPVVIDTSALALAANANDPTVALALRHLQIRYGLVAPAVLASELCNVAHRRQPNDFGRDARERAAVVELLLEGVQLRTSNPGHRQKAGELATTEGLSFYDAEFLATAAEGQGLLVTTDHALAAAGKRVLGAGRTFLLHEAQSAMQRKLL